MYRWRRWVRVGGLTCGRRIVARSASFVHSAAIVNSPFTFVQKCEKPYILYICISFHSPSDMTYVIIIIGSETCSSARNFLQPINSVVNAATHLVGHYILDIYSIYERTEVFTLLRDYLPYRCWVGGLHLSYSGGRCGVASKQVTSTDNIVVARLHIVEHGQNCNVC